MQGLNFIDIVGQIIATLFGAFFLWLAPRLYKKYSEKLSRIWAVILFIVGSIIFISLVYRVSGYDISVTLTAIFFSLLFMGYVTYKEIQILSIFRKENELLEKKFQGAYKTQNEVFDNRLKSLQIENNRLKMEFLVQEAETWKEKEVFVNVLVTSADVLIKDLQLNSPEVNHALDLIQETLQQCDNKEQKIDRYTRNHLLNGLNRVESNSALPVKKILNLMEGL
jgi:hypothetical protein